MLHPEEGKVKQYLSKYQNPEITRRDVINTLQHYNSLSPKLEPFGHIYNIPICIWLMDTHPNNAPMCYVKPTPDMHIKVSIFVDHNGKIYLPYLHDWVPNSSDLLGLIQVMIVTFGEQPPVYAKQRADNTPYPTAHSYMPMPGASSGPSSTQPYLPYPATSSYQPSTSTQYPYPPYHSPMYPNSWGYPYPPPVPTQGYPPQTSPPSSSAATSASSATGTITEEHIRASLLSAVEDKLRRRLREQFSQTQAELETLGRTQQELVQGKNKLDDILARLEKEQVELDKNITILKDKEQELEKAIERLSEQQPLDVDEAVTTTAPLYKQLLNAFAEEAATEDAIYYMGEALRRGVIDLDVFLKQVRSLSRKQFMLRALMHKCRQKAGLAG
ncbi:tumor susceptibility gene 101 protein isoform X3 [Periplaneta americana]|uniref:tumor susceptibility gene 101 protein isoform X3 n=1 Tax=Periplaneta americana TaxID=6978 RepID=UPI0037E8B026